MTDQPVLQSPGETLMGLREAAGRSLNDVAEATKIPPAMLQAIELDEYHKISGELYVKSFLRSYAGEMGMEEEEILRLYGNFMGEAASSNPAMNSAVWQEEEAQIKRLGLPWVTIGMILGAVAILVVAIVYFMNRPGNDSPTLPAGDSGSAVEISRNQEGDSTTMQAGQGESLLAAGPLAEAERATETEDSGENLEPGPEDSPGESASAQTPAVAPEKVSDEVSSAAGEVLQADPDLLVIGGRKWPVVLRLICPREVDIAMKMDGQRDYKPVDWSLTGSISSGNIGQGVAVGVRQGGYVLYWGAEDHFSLMVNDPTGIRASVNGEFRDISGLGPGQEIILNDPAVIRSNLPSAQAAERP